MQNHHSGAQFLGNLDRRFYIPERFCEFSLRQCHLYLHVMRGCVMFSSIGYELSQNSLFAPAVCMRHNIVSIQRFSR